MSNNKRYSNIIISTEVIILAIVLILLGCKQFDRPIENTLDNPSEYIGRYALDTDLVLEVKVESGLLTLLPSFWHATQILDSIDKDSYQAFLHPQMKFEFKRDSIGQINSLI